MTVTIGAVARVAHLQTMIATLQGGPPAAGATFAAHLTQAGAVPATAAVPAGSTFAPATGAVPFGAEIDAAAARHGIGPALLRGLVRQESGFDPTARSGAGALGLTQLMPATARSLGVTDATDPRQALEGGARYLRQQLDRFGGDATMALAAYNAGPGAVQKFGGVPPYTETQAYVRKVLAFAAEYRAPAPVGTIAFSPTRWGTT
jgi:soluble lytic murein transglycosylase-like protein